MEGKVFDDELPPTTEMTQKNAEKFMNSSGYFTDSKAETENYFDAEKEKIQESATRRTNLVRKQIAKSQAIALKAAARVSFDEKTATKTTDTTAVNDAQTIIDNEITNDAWMTGFVSDDQTANNASQV